MFHGPLEPEEGRGGGGRIRMRACTEDATWSRNNNSSPLAPLDPSPDEREVQRLGAGYNARPSTRQPESHQIRFLLLGMAFPRDPDPPCSCHLSCYRTSVKRQRRCPCAGRGWFTNISGEYNYTAPPAEQPYAASGERKGGEQRGREEGGVDTENSFSEPYFNISFQEYKPVSALWFINSTSSSVGLSYRLRCWHAIHLTALYSYTLWLWNEQTAHLPHPPRY